MNDIKIEGVASNVKQLTAKSGKQYWRMTVTDGRGKKLDGGGYDNRAVKYWNVMWFHDTNPIPWTDEERPWVKVVGNVSSLSTWVAQDGTVKIDATVMATSISQPVRDQNQGSTPKPQTETRGPAADDDLPF